METETDDPVSEPNNAIECSNKCPMIEDAQCSSASTADVVVGIECNSGITVLIDNSRKNCDSSTNGVSKGSLLNNNNDLTIGFVDDDDELNDANGLTTIIDMDFKHSSIDDIDGGCDESQTQNGLYNIHLHIYFTQTLEYLCHKFC